MICTLTLDSDESFAQQALAAYHLEYGFDAPRPTRVVWYDGGVMAYYRGVDRVGQFRIIDENDFPDVTIESDAIGFYDVEIPQAE